MSQPLTLSGAIRIALENQNQIGIARSQQSAAEAGLVQARSAYFPTVTPGYLNTYRSATRGATDTQNSATVDLTQTLYDSGKREQTVARGRNAVRAAAYNVTDVRQSVILNVTTDWYELLRSKELVRVAESGVDRAKSTLDATRAFVESGSSARKDVLQVQADYDNSQVAAIQARNNVRLAETTLKQAMGIVTSQPILTVGNGAAAPGPTTDALADDLDRAYNNRPDLRRALQDADSTRRAVTMARIEAGPKVTSTVGATYSAHPNPGTDSVILTSVTYPLFDAGASRAAVREARESARQSAMQIELMRQEIAAGVETAFLQREEARTRIAASQTALVAARENYAAASESHQEGSGTILDVIAAQNQLVTAETNAVQAIYDYFTAAARLERAVGANEPGGAEGETR
jgi:outer membrane protein TolC